MWGLAERLEFSRLGWLQRIIEGKHLGYKEQFKSYNKRLELQRLYVVISIERWKNET